jgi:hypothetical protein
MLKWGKTGNRNPENGEMAKWRSGEMGKWEEKRNRWEMGDRLRAGERGARERVAE